MQEIIIDSLRFNVTDEKDREKNKLIDLYWNFHPRFKFFKGLPKRCTLLDVGASSGGLFYWQDWGLPVRNDIKMYALDLQKGELFHRYQGYFIENLNSSQIPVDEGFFDAALISHVLEHLENTNHFFSEMNRCIKAKGRIYIETPTYETQHFPSRQAFVDNGINMSITNFFDDKTHIKARTLDEIAYLCKTNGFTVLESGMIENKYLEDELVSYGFKNHDPEIIQYGVWLKLRWSQYLIAEKD